MFHIHFDLRISCELSYFSRGYRGHSQFAADANACRVLRSRLKMLAQGCECEEYVCYGCMYACKCGECTSGECDELHALSAQHSEATDERARSQRGIQLVPRARAFDYTTLTIFPHQNEMKSTAAFQERRGPSSDLAERRRPSATGGAFGMNLPGYGIADQVRLLSVSARVCVTISLYQSLCLCTHSSFLPAS